MARPVAYGQVFGSRAIVQVPCQASQPFQANGGKFVAINSNSGRCFLASNNTFGGAAGGLFGWAEVGTFSSSSTAGADVIAVNISDDAVYEMPIVSAISESICTALVHKLCSIETISGIQYANYDDATIMPLQIVGYKYYGSGVGEQTLLVRFSTKSLALVGVGGA